MKPQAWSILKALPDYLALTFASFLSGIGTTFTGLAVFHELARHRVPSLVYAGAFSLSLIPGFLSSHFASRALQRFSAVRLMIGLELIGAAVVFIAMKGASQGSVALLLTALPLASLSYGFLLPFLNTYARSRFQDHEFLAVAEISNFVLVLDLLLGSVLGTLVIESVGVRNFFLLDIFSYVVSAALIYLIFRKFPEPFRQAQGHLETEQKFRWSDLNPKQKQAFLMYPILVAACSPCTAILPGAASNFGISVTFLGFAFTTALVLMLAKTQGQFLGPVVVRLFKCDNHQAAMPLILVCLALFLACYAAVFAGGSLVAALLLVVAAHLFSNVVFTLSYVSFKKEFPAHQIGIAATRQYQWSVVIMLISSLVVGALTQKWGNTVAIFWGYGVLALIFFVVIGLNKK